FVLLHFQHDIQIAGRPAVRPRFAFALHAQPCSGVHAGRDAQLDVVLAFHAPLAAAFEAAFLDDLTRALAIRACAVHGEKSLLVDQLAAPAARLAIHNAGALFRAGAVARFAVLHARHTNLGGDAHGRFVEGQRHVITQVVATLHAAAPATTATRGAKEILETEKVAENIVEVLEDGAVKSALRARARQARMAVSIVNLALLRVAEDAVGFRGFAEIVFGHFLVIRVAVGMPLHRGFAISGLDLVDRSCLRQAQNFVIVSLLSAGHALSLGRLSTLTVYGYQISV